MERYILGCCGSYPYACTSDDCVCLENRGCVVKENFMPDFESRPAFSEQEYLWENHMKKGADCDVLDVDNFVEYLGKAVESKKGAEKWELYRQYAEKGDWHNFGRAVYFLVHDHIEDELL